jgi:hypothetical protein
MRLMKPSVYLETSVVSYLTARPTRDVVMAAHGAETRKWWTERRHSFRLIASEIVLREASAGDPVMVRRRLEALRETSVIELDQTAETLGAALVRNLILPPNAADDALHIAIAATHRLDYLLTWNCRHIADAVLRPKLAGLCQALGYRCPVICTPPELMAETYED